MVDLPPVVAVVVVVDAVVVVVVGVVVAVVGVVVAVAVVIVAVVGVVVAVAVVVVVEVVAVVILMAVDVVVFKGVNFTRSAANIIITYLSQNIGRNGRCGAMQHINRDTSALELGMQQSLFTI